MAEICIHYELVGSLAKIDRQPTVWSVYRLESGSRTFIRSYGSYLEAFEAASSMLRDGHAPIPKEAQRESPNQLQAVERMPDQTSWKVTYCRDGESYFAIFGEHRAEERAWEFVKTMFGNYSVSRS